MSSFTKNKNSIRSIRNFSFALFIMLACLFMTSSCAELNKSHKKQHKLKGKRNNFNSTRNEKLNETYENFPSKLEEEVSQKESKLNVTQLQSKTNLSHSLHSNSNPNVLKSFNKIVKTDLKRFENITFKNAQNEVAERRELVLNTEPQEEKETEPELEENNESSFLETNASVQEKTQSKLNLKQNTNQPSAFDNTVPSTTSNNLGNTNNPQQAENNRPNSVQLQDPKDSFAFANTKVKCTQINCPYPSICVADFVCKCGPEVANYFVDPLVQGNPTYYCVYSRKKQLVAFLLEFFIPPIGHFYAGQYLIATLKLVLPCVFALMFFLIQNSLAKGISGLGICGMSVWWLVDIILYGMNKYGDQNKVPLAAW